jgi:UDP-3-O-[3-hydroxymyristoyl] glucosamine N-acyltransferase
VVQREFTLAALAAALGASLDGDPARVVTGVAPLAAATPSDVSFLTDPRYRAVARATRAGAVVAPLDADAMGPALLRVKHPQQALIRLLELFHPREAAAPGAHPSAVVAAAARIDPTASVGALAVIEAGAAIGSGVRVHPLAYIGENVEVGDESEIHPHAVLLRDVRIGRRVIVHAGAVIGGDGFGYAFDGAAHRKIPQVGTVVIEDDVEVGANTTIDRATLGATVIGRGTKIDNLVQIGHNVEVGAHAILVSQVGISGSSRIGRGAVLAGQVGVADHVTVGDGATVGAQSGLAADVGPGAKVLGSPARPMMQAKRIYLTEEKLPDWNRRIRELERRVERLERPGDGRRDG